MSGPGFVDRADLEMPGDGAGRIDRRSGHHGLSGVIGSLPRGDEITVIEDVVKV